MNLKHVKSSRGNRGQGLTEYAVVLSLMAVAAMASMVYFGGAIKNKIGSVASAVAGESNDKIKEAENKAKASAAKGRKAAESVSGMQVDTDGDSAEVIDTQTLD